MPSLLSTAFATVFLMPGLLMGAGKTPPPRPETASSAGPTEIAFWNSICESTQPEEFEAYLKRFPNGAFADLARIRIRKWTAPVTRSGPGGQAAGAEPGAPAKLIRIATQSPLSGQMWMVGTDIRHGAQLGLEQLSGPLTRLGFKVELAPYNDQANPNVGVTNAKAIVADPAVLGVVGHYNSGVQIPSSEYYHLAGLCNISPANTNPGVTERGYPEVDRICGRDDMQGVACARFAQERGIRSAYLFHDRTRYGQGSAERFKAEGETLGIGILDITGTEEMTSFDPLLSECLATRPDCIYFGGMFDQAAALFKRARQLGFSGLFLSVDGFDAPDAARIGGNALLDGAGTCYAAISGPANAYPGAARFIADFTTRFGNSPQPFAAQSYDAMAVLLKAIETAVAANGGRMPTRSEVSKAVRNGKAYPGITGSIAFNGKGDVISNRYFIIRVTSAVPEKWGWNRIERMLDIAPPE